MRRLGDQATPAVATRRTAVFPILRGSPEVERAFDILCDEATSGSFKWRGASISLESFEESLFSQSLCVLSITGRDLDDSRGVFLVGSPDLRDGHAFIEVAALARSRGTGLVVEGTIGCIDYVFSRWPFHKLYADVDDVSLRQFSSAMRRGVVIEGHFPDHKFRDGRRIGVTRLAIYRSQWQEVGKRLVSGLGVHYPSAGAAFDRT